MHLINYISYYSCEFYIRVYCYSHKPRYERYLKLIYKCLLDDMYTELSRKKIQYGEIIYIYRKAHYPNKG
jgi:hypothetical protein